MIKVPPCEFRKPAMVSGRVVGGPPAPIHVSGVVRSASTECLREQIEVGGPRHVDRTERPALKTQLAEVFRTKTRDDWCALLEGTDCCFAPVLDMDEAAKHEHNQQRHN